MKLSAPCLVMLSVCGLLQAARQPRRAVSPKVDCYSPFDGQTLLRVTPCSKEMVDDMRNAISAGQCEDLSDEGLTLPVAGGCVDERVICPSASVADFGRFGEKVEVVSNDAGAYLREASGVPEAFASSRSVNASANFYSRWRDLADQEKQVADAVKASNGAASIVVMGTTHQGRSMKAVRLRGRGFKSGMPRVVVTFQVHAREWVAGMAGVYAVEKICAKARDNPNWLAGMEVMLIPMGNPDGFHYATTRSRYHRKNMNPNSGGSCKGVDLNRNFPKGFGGRYSTSTRECSEVYIGKRALSEPESKAIAKAVDEAPLSVFLDVHTYGRVILKPWSYTNSPHPRLAEVDKLGKRMLEAMRSVRGNSFRYGGNELLGPASGVLPDYANGGLGYTFEMTTAFDPPTREIEPSAKEAWEGISAAISWAKK